MFRSCAFFVRLAKMRVGTERMRQALRKVLVLALSVGLAVSAPSLSHARTGLSSVAASHESHDLQSYADLAIEPGDDGCPHSASGPTHDQDEGFCKKCCAACLGASLLPNSPVAVRILTKTSELVVQRNAMLVARVIPAEPGIPKPL